MQRNSFSKKSDIFVILFLLLLCVAGYLFVSRKSEAPRYAVIFKNGEIQMILNLGEYTAENATTIELSSLGIPAKVELQAGKIRFIEVDCPDHICEKAGYISEELQSAVCMPNRAAIYIYNEEDAKPYLK